MVENIFNCKAFHGAADFRGGFFGRMLLRGEGARAGAALQKKEKKGKRVRRGGEEEGLGLWKWNTETVKPWNRETVKVIKSFEWNY